MLFLSVTDVVSLLDQPTEGGLLGYGFRFVEEVEGITTDRSIRKKEPTRSITLPSFLFSSRSKTFALK
jgi:hypothetical protein